MQMEQKLRKNSAIAKPLLRQSPGRRIQKKGWFLQTSINVHLPLSYQPLVQLKMADKGMHAIPSRVSSSRTHRMHHNSDGNNFFIGSIGL